MTGGVGDRKQRLPYVLLTIIQLVRKRRIGFEPVGDRPHGLLEQRCEFAALILVDANAVARLGHSARLTVQLDRDCSILGGVRKAMPDPGESLGTERIEFLHGAHVASAHADRWAAPTEAGID